MDAIHYADAALVAFVVVLLLMLVWVRAHAQRRRGRLATARDRFDGLIAECLVSDDPTPAPTGLGQLERAALLTAGLSALVELRGRERERVASLLEEAGLVQAEAAKLRARAAERRRQAADVLGLIGTPAAREPLRAALQDRDVIVRLAAARGLAELGEADDQWSTALVADAAADEELLGPLAELLLALGTSAPVRLGSVYRSSESDDVRRIVVAVMGELRLGMHVAILRDALDATDDELAARAARGLGQLGDVESTESLVAVVRDTGRTWFVRAAASTALGRLGDPDAVPALAAELTADEWPRRRAAAEALAQLGSAGQAALRDAAVDTETEAGRHAAAALDR